MYIVDNFKFFGAWMHGRLVTNCGKWNLSGEIKKRLFLATVESILLYGNETWSFDKPLCKRLDKCYTRTLRMAMNISWRQKLTNQQLHGTLPPVLSNITYIRIRLSGHCIWHPEKIASKLVLWQPTVGRRRQHW